MFWSAHYNIKIRCTYLEGLIQAMHSVPFPFVTFQPQHCFLLHAQWWFLFSSWCFLSLLGVHFNFCIYGEFNVFLCCCCARWFGQVLILFLASIIVLPINCKPKMYFIKKMICPLCTGEPFHWHSMMLCILLNLIAKLAVILSMLVSTFPRCTFAIQQSSIQMRVFGLCFTNSILFFICFFRAVCSFSSSAECTQLWHIRPLHVIGK